jgi:hypothetical protein
MSNLKKLKFIIFLLLLNCATSYAKRLEPIENAVYSGNFEKAIPELRELVKNGDEKDKLLYLMEAGVALHTKGDYVASNKAFSEAEAIADTARTSVSAEALAFALSDNESKFIGEDFERVMIKFYMALNYLCLGDYEAARRYFKKVEFEQKEMKATEPKYKQNILARFLDAVVCEYLGNYNDARVEYKNILALDPNNLEMLAQRYVLAEKEGDKIDKEKYIKGKDYIKSYNLNLNKVEFNLNMGELVIIHQTGKSAVKESRGKLMDDPQISGPLINAIELAIRSESQAGLSVGGVLATLSTAEHPIPIYKDRDQDREELQIFINQNKLGTTQTLTNYSEMAKNSFNDNYDKIVTKNISSIATKAVLAASLAYTAGEMAKRKDDNSSQLVGSLVSFITGLFTGLAVSSSISADLRCWRTIPSRFQAQRIFLEPGEYEVSFFKGSNPVGFSQKIFIEKGKPVFISLRSL